MIKGEDSWLFVCRVEKNDMEAKSVTREKWKSFMQRNIVLTLRVFSFLDNEVWYVLDKHITQPNRAVRPVSFSSSEAGLFRGTVTWEIQDLRFQGVRNVHPDSLMR